MRSTGDSELQEDTDDTDSDSGDDDGGADDLPQRFLDAEKGDAVKGRLRYEATCRWREENGIDGILDRPHPDFECIKKNSVQYFHGRCKGGQPIYIEIPRMTDVKSMRKVGITVERLLFHYAYITEYMWQEMDTSDVQTCLSILDVEGVGLRDLVGDVLDCVRQMIGMTGTHYPARSYMIFVVNAHWSFSGIWKMLRVFMHPDTVAKTHVFRKSQAGQFHEKLFEIVDRDQIPEYYGGTCQCTQDPGAAHEAPWPNTEKYFACMRFSDDEKGLFSLVEDKLQGFDPSELQRNTRDFEVHL